MQDGVVTKLAVDQLIEECYETAKSKGWWESGDRNFGELIALCHSELSEAFEEYRNHGLDPKWLLYDEKHFEDGVGNVPTFHNDPQCKTEGIAAELADVLVRIFDFCGHYQIPLAAALEAKMAYNKNRSYRHGGKKA